MLHQTINDNGTKYNIQDRKLKLLIIYWIFSTQIGGVLSKLTRFFFVLIIYLEGIAQYPWTCVGFKASHYNSINKWAYYRQIWGAHWNVHKREDFFFWRKETDKLNLLNPLQRSLPLNWSSRKFKNTIFKRLNTLLFILTESLCKLPISSFIKQFTMVFGIKKKPV